jgi:hypothetical protein
MCDCRRGLDWWMDLLTTYTHDSELQAVTAPPPITTAPAKPFPACCVFTSRSLATASDSGDASASRPQVLSSQTAVQNWLGCPSCLQDNSSARTRQKHPVSNSTSIVARRFVAAGTCLSSRCLETGLVYLSVSLSSHSNGSPLYYILVFRIEIIFLKVKSILIIYIYIYIYYFPWVS